MTEKKTHMLSEAEGYSLLRKYNVPAPVFEIVTSPEDAAKAAEKIGYPVVMKIVSPQIIHKSDAGGVVVGVPDAEGAKAAYEKIITSVKAYNPEAEIKGIIVEEMAKKGLELIIGGKIDPAFGRVITFGMGGTMVEFHRDVAIRLLPVTDDEIRSLIQSIKGYTLIKGYRGDAPKDEEFLFNTIKNACTFFETNENVVEFDINPLLLYEKGGSAVDARVIVQDEPVTLPIHYDPEKIVPVDYFKPASVAVIGASDDKTKMGYAAFHNLLQFTGPVYPVNNKREEIQGRKCYPSISAIPGHVDMVVLTIPAKFVPSTIEECGQKGVKMAVIITAGFKEMNEEGRALEAKVVEIARKYGVRIVGPNCLGLILPPYKLDTTYVAASPLPGDIAFISQSGAMANAVVGMSLTKGQELGFSEVVSVGNQCDLDYLDYLGYAANDPHTKSIILYVEEIKNGVAFMEMAREITKKKPIIAIKAGSSKRGQAAAASHTGSLSGAYEVYMEAFRKCGVIAVTTVPEAFQCAKIMGALKKPLYGKRAVVITNAGGFAVLSNDYAERRGIDIVDIPEHLIKEMDTFLPEFWNRNNPVDLLGDADEARFRGVLDVLTREENETLWDIAVIITFPNKVLSPEQVGQVLIDYQKKSENLVVGSFIGGDCLQPGVDLAREHNIPVFDELEFVYRTLGLMTKNIIRK
ncbi:MAG: acetate--CoA ligase family protein [Methanocorpusculum sp.]|nr:acetate--CoA ligase family protein [Methanocorpusculum sp.]HJJ45115.1 acetate--CoA ligase family protein [Methanocorpusculum sp.]